MQPGKLRASDQNAFFDEAFKPERSEAANREPIIVNGWCIQLQLLIICSLKDCNGFVNLPSLLRAQTACMAAATETGAQLDAEMPEDQSVEAVETEPTTTIAAEVVTERQQHQHQELQSASNDENSREKASIFVSYSPDAGFLEKRFISRLVTELKSVGLADSIWFDKDEGLFESSAWVGRSLEAAEKCFAAVLFLSGSFFTSRLTLHAMRTLAERLHDNRTSLHLFAVLLDADGRRGLERQCPPILAEAISQHGTGEDPPAKLIDLTDSRHRKASESELIAHCSSRLAPQLERFTIDFRPLLPEPLLPAGYTGEFASKRFLAWTVNDMQEWLRSLDVREFYRQQFAEQGVDGFLAYSLTDADLAGPLRIDVQLSRKKLTREILNRLQAEQRDSWSGRCRTTRPRPGTVFLVCDPRRDVKTRDALKLALERRRVRVSYVEDLGESRDDFLRKNGPAMAACGHVLVLLTENSPRSAVFYHCVMFAEWLGRRIILLFLTNSWFQLRPALRALLYDVEGLDFSGQPVADSLEELSSAIVAPDRAHPSVVLEQSYVKKLARKLPPAGYLAHTSAPSRSLDSAASSGLAQPASAGFIRSRTGTHISLASSVSGQRRQPQPQEPSVFISYHWDSTETVMELRRYLIGHGVRVQLDTDKSPEEGSMKIMKGVRDDGSRKLFIEKAVRDCHCVLLAVTPKYLRSDNCLSDIEAAHRQRRPLLPLLMTFCAWPPDSSCSPSLRKRLAAVSAIDIGNERLAKQNLAKLMHRIQQFAAAAGTGN